MRVIPKLSTGFTPIQYLYASSAKTKSAGVENTPASSKSDEGGLLSEKVQELLAQHALPSDMHSFLNNASLLQSSVMGGSVANSPSKVKELLMYMNKMHHELEMFKTNLTRINSIDAQGEAAIADNGGVFVYRDDKVLIVSPNLLRSGEKALTNTLLMNIRANSSKYAFDTRLTSALSNATSMKLIRGVIQDVLSKVNDETVEYSTVQSGASEDNSIIGMISAVQVSEKDLARLGADAIIKRSVSNTNNANAIKNAIKTIYSLLDPSMKTLVALRAREASLMYGNKVSPIDIILLYTVHMAKNINDTDIDIQANPGWEDPNKAKGADGSLDEFNEGMPLTASAIALAGLGHKTPVTINPGSHYEINTKGIVSGFTHPSGGSIGEGPLSAITSSEQAHMLDFNNVTIGGVKINKEQFGEIYMGASNYHMILMPIDPNSRVVKPDINLVKKVEAVEEEIKAKGITDPVQINKYYQSKGLAVKYSGRDANGRPILNPRAYKKFVVVDVVLDEQGLPKLSGDAENEFRLFVKTADESIINSVTARMKKFNEDFEFKGKNYFSEDDIWRGTVYIPVHDHMVNAYSGSTQHLKVDQGLTLDLTEVHKLLRQLTPYNRIDPKNANLNY